MVLDIAVSMAVLVGVTLYVYALIVLASTEDGRTAVISPRIVREKHITAPHGS